MYKFFLAIAFFVAGLSLSPDLQAADFYYTLPKHLEATTIFAGDRHGDFKGDFVAHLSDGSAWKIHPDSKEIYSQWQSGDVLSIQLRTDSYVFKREHKFELINNSRGGSAKAMIVKHMSAPEPLHVVSSYYSWIEEKNYTGIILSDGSVWTVNRSKLFNRDTPVYVAVLPKHYPVYDGVLSETYFFPLDKWDYQFVLIIGDQREAVATDAASASELVKPPENRGDSGNKDIVYFEASF